MSTATIDLTKEVVIGWVTWVGILVATSVFDVTGIFGSILMILVFSGWLVCPMIFIFIRGACSIIAGNMRASKEADRRRKHEAEYQFERFIRDCRK